MLTTNATPNVSARLDAFFDPSKPQTSFRELYIDITGDRYVTGRRDAATRLREALGTADFSQVLGDSVTRRMVAEYQASNLQNWRGVVADVVPITDSAPSAA